MKPIRSARGGSDWPKLDELVSRRITLDEINEGFEAMRRGEVARSVIAFE